MESYESYKTNFGTTLSFLDLSHVSLTLFFWRWLNRYCSTVKYTMPPVVLWQTMVNHHDRDHSAKLPPEALGLIFGNLRDILMSTVYDLEFPQAPMEDTPSDRGINRWIDVTLICRRWHYVALLCPSLWAYILCLVT